MKITVLECVGGWLVVYAQADAWVSAITYPKGTITSVWMLPGWRDD